jgi:hypothetical protein
MYDNKVRLSPDVLEKARLIAEEWGLKNTRAAVEAVFRKYADEYLGGGQRMISGPPVWSMPAARSAPESYSCEALDELDDLLGA